jgi:hypothetical protein
MAAMLAEYFNILRRVITFKPDGVEFRILAVFGFMADYRKSLTDPFRRLLRKPVTTNDL